MVRRAIPRLLAKKDAKMCGLDFATTFISHARAAGQQTPLYIEYHLADCKNLPFARASFDFVVAFMSLMNVEDVDRALGEAHQILCSSIFLQFSILQPCFSTIGSQKVLTIKAI